MTRQHRDLETRQISTTLSASSDHTWSRSDSVNFEANLGGSYTNSEEEGQSFTIEGGLKLGYNYQYSDQNATSAEQAYENSLSTDKEVTRGFSVERNVVAP